MCDERERLIGYIYDECAPAERRAVDVHLEQCPECRAEIQALRQVRADLLAWEVPGQPQVWRFPVPVAQPWWKQVPAWAMSAAAGLVLAAGLAGGVAARAFEGPRTDAMLVAAPPPAPSASGVTHADLTAAQQRILGLMRAELDQQAARVSSLRQNVRFTGGIANPALQQVSALTRDSEDMFETVAELYNETQAQRSRTDQRIRALEQQIAALDFALRTSLGAGGAGGSGAQR